MEQVAWEIQDTPRSPVNQPHFLRMLRLPWWVVGQVMQHKKRGINAMERAAQRDASKASLGGATFVEQAPPL